jgi:hypothetical protein
VGDQRHAPAALPPGKTRYPLYRRLGRPLCWSGQVRKISPPPEFDPWTVQPVASHYTDWAIAAPAIIYIHVYFTFAFVCLLKLVRGKISLFVLELAVHTFFAINLFKKMTTVFSYHVFTCCQSLCVRQLCCVNRLFCHPSSKLSIVTFRYPWIHRLPWW